MGNGQWIHGCSTMYTKNKWAPILFNFIDFGIVYVSPACPGVMERRLPRGAVHHGEHAMAKRA
eukprot:432019-Karenia_brevis.AAC.1